MPPESPGRSRLPVRPPLWILFLLWVGLLAIGAFTFPAHHLLFWTPMGLSAVIAGVVGVRRYRPSHPVAWYLFYLALLCFIGGDSVYDVLTEMLNQDNPYPSRGGRLLPGDVPAGRLRPARPCPCPHDQPGLGQPGRRADHHHGLGLLSWVYLILPYVNAAGLTPLQRATSIAYPLCDVLVLAMLARLLGGGLRIRALQLLALGAGGLLASDVLYGWIQLHGTWHVGGPVDTGWALCYSAWGAAALHPSMRRVSEPPPPVHKRVRGGQVALLAATSLIAPAVLLGEAITGQGNHAATVAVFSAALNLLVVTRLAVIVGVHRASGRRERVLRSCGESLVSAQEPDDVYHAAVAAVDLLAGEAAEVRAGLYVVGRRGDQARGRRAPGRPGGRYGLAAGAAGRWPDRGRNRERQPAALRPGTAGHAGGPLAHRAHT